MANPVVNFCQQEGMSVCTANSNKNQVDCGYYEKAGHENRCMYFIFDEYCDSLKAQMNAAVTEGPKIKIY